MGSSTLPVIIAGAALALSAYLLLVYNGHLQRVPSRSGFLRVLGRMLRRLDEIVLGRTYGTAWWIAASTVGLVLLVVGAWGIGRNVSGPLGPAAALFVLPLYELWCRRRIRQGRPLPLRWMKRLDERILKRR